MNRPDLPSRQRRLRALREQIAESDSDQAAFEALDQALNAIVGHRLFTLLIHHPASQEVERIYSNQPEAYPVTGRKQMGDTPWYQQVVVERRHCFAPGAADVRATFPDYEVINALGCASAINVVCAEDDEFLGSANLLHAEHHYQARDPELCAPFVALLAPIFRRFQHPG